MAISEERAAAERDVQKLAVAIEACVRRCRRCEHSWEGALAMLDAIQELHLEMIKVTGGDIDAPEDSR